MRSYRFHRQSQLVPRSESSGERMHFADSGALQLQSGAGAGCFIRTSAIKNDVVIRRDLVRAVAKVVGMHDKRAADFQPHLLDFSGIAEIYYGDRAAAFDKAERF